MSLAKLRERAINDVEVVRALVADEQLGKSRDRLISLLSRHVDKDLTMMEAVLIRTLFDIGISEVKKKGVDLG